jgi:hypothetical protein
LARPLVAGVAAGDLEAELTIGRCTGGAGRPTDD